MKSEMGFQCPFCGVDGLPDLTEFWSHVDIAGLCPGKAVGVKVSRRTSLFYFIFYIKERHFFIMQMGIMAFGLALCEELLR